MKDYKSYIKNKIQLGYISECVSLEDCLEAIEMAYNDGLKDNKVLSCNDSDIKEYFEMFRIAYKGTKRGLSTEYSNFKKKHKDYAEIAPKLYDLYLMQTIRRDAMKERGDWMPQLPNLQTYINQRRWEEAESISSSFDNSNDKHYDDAKLGEKVYILNGKKYYGNGKEIPMNAPRRPSIQYTYSLSNNNWFIE